MTRSTWCWWPSSYTGASDFITALGRDAEFTIQVQKQVRYKRAINAGTNPSTSPAANDPLYCLSTDPLFTCVKIGAPLQINRLVEAVHRRGRDLLHLRSAPRFG